LDLVTNLAKEYSCPIGQSKVRPPQDKADMTQNYHPVPRKSGESLSGEAQKQLMDMQYPLLPDMIDFRRIKQWLVSYQALSQAVGNQVSPSLGEALEDVDKLLNQGFNSQSLHDNADNIYRAIYGRAVKHMIQAQAIHWPLAYLKMLNELMINIKRSLQDFKHDFWYDMHPEWQSDFNTQINNSTNSYAETATRQIDQWINALPAAQTKVEREES
jgi:hypothetical protein